MSSEHNANDNLVNKEVKTLFFFSHRNHSDEFNGTSVYDNELLKTLEKEFKLVSLEPDYSSQDLNRTSNLNFNSFVSLLFRVYFKQLRWLFGFVGREKQEYSDKIVLLVEDVYSSILPFIVSKAFSIKLIYRAADFGKAYYNTLSISNKIFKFLYPPIRRIIERFIVKGAFLIICPSSRIRKDIIEKYPELEAKTTILPYISKNASGNINFKSDSERTRVLKVNIVLLGDYRYPPNRQAAEFVLNELTEKLSADANCYNILIVGSSSDLLFESNDRNIEILGAVKDLDDVLLHAHIGLAPTTTIGGLSMKIVNYLVHGLRVIATPEASAGIIPNEQMKVASLENFPEVLDNEIADLIDYGFSRHISSEVFEEYMSDKWKDVLIDKLRNI